MLKLRLVIGFEQDRTDQAYDAVLDWEDADDIGATFYNWRSRYGGMEVSDARRLKSLEDENRRLKKLLAASMLDVATLKEALGKF